MGDSPCTTASGRDAMRRSRTLEEFVFWHIFHCQQCLRGDLADCFGVNPATISRAIESVAAAARRGAPIAATAIGLGVANAVQILNPSLVVLCGRLASAAGESLVKAVDTIVRQRCVATATRRLEVRVSPPKKDISAVGCALLAAEAEAERLVRLCLLGGQAARRQTERWP